MTSTLTLTTTAFNYSSLEVVWKLLLEDLLPSFTQHQLSINKRTHGLLFMALNNPDSVPNFRFDQSLIVILGAHNSL